MDHRSSSLRVSREPVYDILNQIDKLSQSDMNTLYRTAREKHVQDPFHDVTTCELCNAEYLPYSDTFMCSGCAKIFKQKYDPHQHVFFRCLICKTEYAFCNVSECYDRIFQYCHRVYAVGEYKGVCNWCAVNLPSQVQCSYPCQDTGCTGSFQNRHCQSVTMKSAYKVPK